MKHTRHFKEEMLNIRLRRTRRPWPRSLRRTGYAMSRSARGESVSDKVERVNARGLRRARHENTGGCAERYHSGLSARAAPRGCGHARVVALYSARSVPPTLLRSDDYRSGLDSIEARAVSRTRRPAPRASNPVSRGSIARTNPSIGVRSVRCIP